MILNAVFKTELPSYSLRQIGDYCLTLLDRIFKVPNDLIQAISPLILWFTLHIEDGLVQTMFDLVPDLLQELSRLHMIIQENIEEQYLTLKLKDDEENQFKIVQLIGTTLLPEENMLVGFMPLKSYLENKKDIKTGIKCP